VKISLALSAFALVLAGLFIFVNMRPLTNELVRIFNTLAASFRPLPAQFRQLLAKFDGHAGLFLLGGLGLLSAALFDHILKQQTLRGNR
jgi:hypothetical protein